MAAIICPTITAYDSAEYKRQVEQVKSFAPRIHIDLMDGEFAHQIMHSFDHVLVFSGNLGHHGGEADLGLLDKVRSIREHHPEVEIGWDGGINDQNAKQLIDAGVDVLNVGGFIQKADNPKAAYDKILQSV
jgi:pentose-5-phosphate-3-epimerase